MNKVVKLHGCSGAGKTTLAKSLLDHSTTTFAIMGAGKKPEGYELHVPCVPGPIFLLGPYDLNSGGVDALNSAQQVMDMVDEFYGEGHVIFEGLLYSTYYGKMGEHSLKYGADYVYGFMDTPIEVCLQRVVERRARNGTTSKFDPKVTEDKHATILRVKKKVTSFGHTIIELPGERPGALDILLNTLKG